MGSRERWVGGLVARVRRKGDWEIRRHCGRELWRWGRREAWWEGIRYGIFVVVVKDFVWRGKLTEWADLMMRPWLFT